MQPGLSNQDLLTINEKEHASMDYESYLVFNDFFHDDIEIKEEPADIFRPDVDSKSQSDAQDCNGIENSKKNSILNDDCRNIDNLYESTIDLIKGGKQDIAYQQHCKRGSATKPERKCDICRILCPTGLDLILHRLTHAYDTHYTCCICFKFYTCKKRLSIHIFKCHLRLSHPKYLDSTISKQVYQCDICHKIFPHKFNLIRHEIRTHKSSISKRKSFSNSNSFDVVHKYLRNNKKNLVCTTCDKQFDNINNLILHNQIHTGKKYWKCNICNRSFNSAASLKRHNLVHTGEKPWKCIICHRSFSSATSLKRHNLVHTGEKPWKCIICHRSFSTLGNLKRHNLVHTSEKPWKCIICHRSFSTLGILKRHNLVHTSEKPWKCNICHRSFKIAIALKRHNLIHTGEKPFECDICQRRFNLRHNLKRHKLVHNFESTECEVCHGHFSSRRSFNMHKCNRKTKPYPCRVCSQTFKSFTDVNAHVLKIHKKKIASKKLIKCNICRRQFKLKCHLTRHMSIHKEEELIHGDEYPGQDKHGSGEQEEIINEISDKTFVSQRDENTHVIKIHKKNTESRKLYGDVYLDQEKYNIFEQDVRNENCVDVTINPQPSQPLKTDSGIKKTYECNICHTSFKGINHLRTHKQDHRSRKPFGCSVCGRRLKHLETLNRHKKEHETHANSFECSVCQKLFRTVEILDRHKVLHGNDRPFECQFCYYRFTREDVLARHIKEVHKALVLNT